MSCENTYLLPFPFFYTLIRFEFIYFRARETGPDLIWNHTQFDISLPYYRSERKMFYRIIIT